MMKNKKFQVLTIIIILLALTGVSCGVSGFGGLLATSTPTFTATFTSTATSTPSPTLTLTPTQTLTPTPRPSGVVLETLSDGSTLVTDYDDLYKIVLPSGWNTSTLDPSETTIGDMITSLPTLNPNLSSKELEGIVKSLQFVDLVRALALNKDPLYEPTFSPSIEVSATDDKGLRESFVSGKYEQETRNSGSKIIEGIQRGKRNANGVEYGTIEFERPTLSNHTTTIMARYRIAFFVVNDKLIMVKLVAATKYMNTLIPTWAASVESIELLEP